MVRPPRQLRMHRLRWISIPAGSRKIRFKFIPQFGCPLFVWRRLNHCWLERSRRRNPQSVNARAFLLSPNIRQISLTSVSSNFGLENYFNLAQEKLLAICFELFTFARVRGRGLKKSPARTRAVSSRSYLLPVAIRAARTEHNHAIADSLVEEHARKVRSSFRFTRP
jgi:hypothetical protein